ncbi:hypothetical protein K435DRAFT_605351, partial [Dendrothele bispora CBS 962.96]
RDRGEVLERYHRLMLIFFKPWRTITDLKSNSQTWEDAFGAFVTNCSIEFKHIMDKMQLQHECRDSRDD